MVEDAIILSGANDNGRRIFQVGVNCEAEAYFNKDAKDPMKYEQEGGKAQIDTDAMIELYKKLMADHPLLSYIEDPFG
jgi:enolase